MDTVSIWLYTLISIIIVSLISLIGLFTFSIKIDKLKKVLFFLVSFAAGTMFGDAFIHILPEAVRQYGFSIELSLYLLLGIFIFFVLEKFIHWRHCHVPTSKNHPHPLVFMNVVGDGMHNLIDGMVIAASYMVNVHVGIATTIAVIAHEIPQEIGDFGILLHAGIDKYKALFFNFISGLTALVGGIIWLVIGTHINNANLVLLPITAGGFIYIAGSDLIPELHKETAGWKSLLQLGGIVLGVVVMVLLLFLE